MTGAEIKAGDMIMHDGIPMRLLYRKSSLCWRVQPLFVIAEPRDEWFGSHDTVSKIHTSFA
jgi:hypothetical protein